MFVVANPTYPRLGVEKSFKTIYNLGALAHLISLVVVMTEFYLRLQSSIPNYFTSSQFTMGDTIRLVMTNCDYTADITLGSVTGKNVVSLDSIPIGMMFISQYILAILIVELLLIITTAMNTMNYTTGNRHLRVLGFHIPMYHIQITFTYVYSIVIICMVWIVYSQRMHYNSAVNECAEKLRSSDPTALLIAEFDTYHIFGTPIEWPFAAAVITIVLNLAGVIVRLYRTRDVATILFSEANWPWESRKVNCTVIKSRLATHAREREAIFKQVNEAIARGERVRIVRSYRVVNEEEYLQKDRDAEEEKQKKLQEERLAVMMDELEVGEKLGVGRTTSLPIFSWGRRGVREPPPPPDMADSFFSHGFGGGVRNRGGAGPYRGENVPYRAYFDDDRRGFDEGIEMGDEYAGSPIVDPRYFSGGRGSAFPVDDEDYNGGLAPKRIAGLAESDLEERDDGSMDEDGVVYTPESRRRRKHKRKRRHRHSRSAAEAVEEFAEDPYNGNYSDADNGEMYGEAQGYAGDDGIGYDDNVGDGDSEEEYRESRTTPQRRRHRHRVRRPRNS